MEIPPLPINEEARLASLYSYRLLDTLPEQDYDNLTKLASAICNTPVSLITLLDKDRQWFKSVYGFDKKETSREYAFCAHTILQPNDIMIVPDAQKDVRFVGNPLVDGASHVIFYAGVPILSADGYPLGSLCVIDHKPNSLTAEQTEGLKILANQVMRLIELHKTNTELAQSREHLQEVNNELKKFAQVIANDLQKPCDIINELTDIVIDKYNAVLDVDGQQILSLVKYSCENMKTTVDATLKRAQLTQLHQEEKMLVSFTQLMEELRAMLPAALQPVLHYEPVNTNLYTYKKMVLQALLCFVSNGVEYNGKVEKSVRVSYTETEHQYAFAVEDNGLGLAVIQRNGTFELFGADGNSANNEYKAYLENLNYARQLIHKLNGKIEAAFEEGTGSRFVLSVGR